MKETETIGGDLTAEFWGTENFCRRDFWMTFPRPKFPFSRPKFPFSRPKFLMTLFNHWPCFFRFSYLFLIFHIFTACNVVCDPFHENSPYFISENNSLMTSFFYSVRSFARIRQTLLFKILGGRMLGPSPTSNLGGQSPQSPLGLRPWLKRRFPLTITVIVKDGRKEQKQASTAAQNGEIRNFAKTSTALVVIDLSPILCREALILKEVG